MRKQEPAVTLTSLDYVGNMDKELSAHRMLNGRKHSFRNSLEVNHGQIRCFNEIYHNREY